MTAITLEAIEAAQKRLEAMIAAFRAQPVFPITISAPALKPGEKFIGVILSADGSRRHALILLPGEIEEATWKRATEWAAKQGGKLPDRLEGALLFATLKNEFKPEWYWTRERHAGYADSADSAWCQAFLDGGQDGLRKDFLLRARAVYRVPV